MRPSTSPPTAAASPLASPAVSPTETMPTSPARARQSSGPEHKEEHHLPITPNMLVYAQDCGVTMMGERAQPDR